MAVLLISRGTLSGGELSARGPTHTARFSDATHERCPRLGRLRRGNHRTVPAIFQFQRSADDTRGVRRASHAVMMGGERP